MSCVSSGCDIYTTDTTYMYMFNIVQVLCRRGVVVSDVYVWILSGDI